MKLEENIGVRSRSHLTDEHLVVELVCILAQPICHVGDPVSQMVHSILAADAGGKTHNHMVQSRTQSLD